MEPFFLNGAYFLAEYLISIQAQRGVGKIYLPRFTGLLKPRGKICSQCDGWVLHEPFLSVVVYVGPAGGYTAPDLKGELGARVPPPLTKRPHRLLHLNGHEHADQGILLLTL